MSTDATPRPAGPTAALPWLGVPAGIAAGWMLANVLTGAAPLWLTLLVAMALISVKDGTGLLDSLFATLATFAGVSLTFVTLARLIA